MRVKVASVDGHMRDVRISRDAFEALTHGMNQSPGYNGSVYAEDFMSGTQMLIVPRHVTAVVILKLGED